MAPDRLVLLEPRQPIPLETDEAGDWAVVLVEYPSDRRVTARQTVKLSPGTNRFALKLSIPNPQLWWPAGLGSQKLYTLRARLLSGGRVSDELSTRTGLRTLDDVIEAGATSQAA